MADAAARDYLNKMVAKQVSEEIQIHIGSVGYGAAAAKEVENGSNT
jgi:hypothetical protein